MAVIFHKNLRNAFICNPLMRGIFNVGGFSPGSPGGTAYTIFGGAQPTGADVVANWATYYTAYLLHLYQVAQVYQPGCATPDIGIALLNYGTPTAETSFNAGTATWAILWNGSPTPVTMASGTLPSASFMIVPVSDTSGTAPLRLASTTIAAATSYTISDFSLTAGGGNS